MARRRLAVVAFGGNALIRSDQEGTQWDQLDNARATARALLPETMKKVVRGGAECGGVDRARAVEAHAHRCDQLAVLRVDAIERAASFPCVRRDYSKAIRCVHANIGRSP